MRVSYKGMNADYNYRVAEISYDDEKETETLFKIAKIMEDECGWKIEIVGDGYANCEVDDREDYKSFMEDWKAAKKAAKKVAEETVEEETFTEETETETIESSNQNNAVSKYTDEILVEIYKNLKTSAKILEFTSASDSEMMKEIELEAIKRHINLIEESFEEIKEETKMMTVRELREMLFNVDNQEMTVRELRELLFNIDDQDEELSELHLMKLTRIEAPIEEAPIEEAPNKKTKTFMACVTLNGKVEVLTMEYPTKKAFAADVRANGYKIQFISTPEKFDEDCEKYHEAVEKTKRIHKAQYDTYKNSVMRNEITFKEWRAWLKAE